jgi:hypothetical protein
LVLHSLRDRRSALAAALAAASAALEPSIEDVTDEGKY